MTPLTERGPEWAPNLDHVRAVCYIRQSKKREDDSQSSPQAQKTKCEALITAKGWDIAGHFADVGKSGWDPNVERPQFEEMMTAVRAGQVDAVVIFALSRLTRKGALDAMLINDELARHGVRLVSVEEPYLDTSTPIGIAIFGLIAGLAQQESDIKSAFITATKETLRSAGSHVSGIAPYGFVSEPVQRGELTVRKLAPHPTEAEHVRDMVRLVHEGSTVHAVAQSLNANGVKTKTEGLGEKGVKRLAARRANGSSTAIAEGLWTSSTVIRVLRDPRLAGFAAVWEGRVASKRDEAGNKVPGKVGKRVILRDDDGAPVVAHDAIIPPAEWWALQDVLNGRTKTVVRSGRSVPTLLAGHGFLFCDVCGSVMVADTRNGARYYKCNRAATGVTAGHGGLSINMVIADDEVARRVWARLTSMDPENPDDLEWLTEASARYVHQLDTSEYMEEEAAARAELEHVRAALRTMYQDRQDGLYEGDTGRAMFSESVVRLGGQEERLKARLRELERPDVTEIRIPSDWTLVDGDPIGEGSTWAAMDLERKREFLSFFVDSVRVRKAIGRGRNSNTRDRIELRWAATPNVEKN
ncbi:recombinase family protein [Streptomyces buecherae]|uniref:recombinase family protein n=1 Tax=Streptomyces buecherae TaxID=2763006 RepID=UPI0037928BB0